MAVLDRIATARNDEFAARVAMITMKLCVDVANEAGTVTNHTNRIAFAYKMFKATVNAKALAAAVIANNATIQTTIDSSPSLMGSNVPDADLEFVISSMLNNFANAYAAA